MDLPSGIDWDDRIGRRLRLRDLHVLLAAAQAGSMAKAATRLGVSQPAVSQAIADLEAALGVKLLERGPRGVTPTNFGETLLRRGTEAFDALKQAARDIEFLADPGAGEVLVGASESYVAGGVLAVIIHRLAQRYPRLAIRVEEANTAAPDFLALRERRLDLMLGRLAPASVAADLGVKVLFDEPIFVVAGAQNAWAHEPGLGLATLAEKPWVLAPPDTAVHALVVAAFRAEGLAPPRVGITTWSMNLRLQLLAQGEYVTAFPGSLLRSAAGRWALRALPVTLGPPLPVAIVALRNRRLSPAVQRFIAEARAVTTELMAQP